MTVSTAQASLETGENATSLRLAVQAVQAMGGSEIVKKLTGTKLATKAEAERRLDRELIRSNRATDVSHPEGNDTSEIRKRRASDKCDPEGSNSSEIHRAAVELADLASMHPLGVK